MAMAINTLLRVSRRRMACMAIPLGGGRENPVMVWKLPSESLRKIKEKREAAAARHPRCCEECAKTGKRVKKMQTLTSCVLPCGNSVPE
jgi:hypothetical protein